METLFRTDKILVERDGDSLFINGGRVRIVYHLDDGKADLYRPDGGGPVFSGLYAETEAGGKKISSAGLKRDGGCVSVEALNDGFGAGVKITVRNSGPALSILQNYYVYEARDYILLEAVVESPGGTETNYIAPVAAGTGDYAKEVLNPGEAEDPRFLFVPFDNDAFVRYASLPLMAGNESYEVTAVFDNTARDGFVIGSVSHDTWKTGVRIKQGMNNAVIDFRVFGGISSPFTRDSLPHGMVKGERIPSPKIFFGFFADWRDGMEEYGRANGIVSPPLAWDDGPPFGWNSWSAVADKVSYDIYVEASDFVKNSLQDRSFNSGGVVYINFDSFWDNLTEAQLKDAARHVKENGQRPGIYYTPFTYWGGDHTARPVEGTDQRYTYQDIVLKDRNGKTLPAIDGGVPIDPTHPGNTARVNYQIGKFLEWGFEYVKLDFMAHGAVEGEHYDKTVSTGIQAYNYGMGRFLEALGDRVKDKTFFISLSIAPLFPAQYAHGRRVSCDVFGTIDNAEYMLNSLSYGWWLNNAVYPFNDPDHIVVYNSYNHRQEILYNEGLTRYISTAIGGGFMIDSDDFRQGEARERAGEILTHAAVNRLAAEGISFRPVEGNTGNRACDAFVRRDMDGTLYLAVFNFSADKPKTMKLSLERLGLDPAQPYRMLNLLSGAEETVSGTVEIELERAEPKIFRLYER